MCWLCEGLYAVRVGSSLVGVYYRGVLGSVVRARVHGCLGLALGLVRTHYGLPACCSASAVTFGAPVKNSAHPLRVRPVPRALVILGEVLMSVLMAARRGLNRCSTLLQQ